MLYLKDGRTHLADKPEHRIERRPQDRIPEDNPWGFRLAVPELLYHRGELHNLSVGRGTLSEEDRYKINEHIVQTIRMLSTLPFPKHLREVPRQVFARNPSVVGMSQGHLGDCFFVSTMGGFVHRNPAEIRKIIHQNPDGSFDVSFNPNHKVHVPALTDGLICLGSTAHDQGLWLNIMEEGAGQAHHAKKGSTNTNEPAVDRLGIEKPDGTVNELGTRWRGGKMVLHPADPTLATKETEIDLFFHKIVMIRNNLRVLEQKINSHEGLSSAEKFDWQQYVTRCYGSLTTFNVLFRDEAGHFGGQG